MNVRETNDSAQWDDLVRRQGGHPLQLWGWGELKAKHNWRAHRLVVEDSGRLIGGAQVLLRTMPWPLRGLLYVPRGPIGDLAMILPALDQYLATNFRATHVVIEPHQTEPLRIARWRRAAKAVLIPNTIILNLARSQDELLHDMAKKTRQYIRKSANSGVEVRRADMADLPRCLAIYHQTAQRANFSLHSDGYYRDIAEQLGQASVIYVAEYQGQIVAFLWLAVTPRVAFELYGGMDETGQRVRANYCLKWQAIRDMKADGVEQYDLNGLLNDGVSNFKRSFATEETGLAGSYERPLSVWYWPWKLIFPAVKRGLQIIASLRK